MSLNMSDAKINYGDLDTRLEMYSVLGEIFGLRTEHSSNRNFLLTSEEYEYALDELKEKVMIVLPDSNLQEVNLEPEHLLVTRIKDVKGEDNYAFEMSINLYINYLYFLSSKFFKDSDEANIYKDIMVLDVENDHGAFISLMFNLMDIADKEENQYKDLLVGVLNFENINNRTFSIGDKTYPLVSRAYLPILTVLVAKNIELKNNLTDNYETVTVEDINNIGIFSSKFLKLTPENTVGYLDIRMKPVGVI